MDKNRTEPPNLYPKPSEMTEDEREIGELMWAVMMETRWGSSKGTRAEKRRADVVSNAARVAAGSVGEEEAETSDLNKRGAGVSRQQFEGDDGDDLEA